MATGTSLSIRILSTPGMVGGSTPIGYGTGSQENSLFALAAILDAVGGDPRRIVPGHEAAVFDQFPSRPFDDGLMAAEDPRSAGRRATLAGRSRANVAGSTIGPGVGGG